MRHFPFVRHLWILTAVALLAATLSCGSSERPALVLNTGDSGESREQADAGRKGDARDEKSGEESSSSDESSGRGESETGEEPTGKVTLSSVKKDGSSYSIVLNGVLAVKDVRIKDGKFGEYLAFPAEKSKDGKFWDYVRLSRGDKELLLKQVNDEKTEKSPEGFKITNVEVNFRDSGKLLAFLKFELEDGAVNLSSFKLLTGKDGPWLGVPSENKDGEWEDLVFPVSKEFREELTKAAVEAYKEAGGKL